MSVPTQPPPPLADHALPKTKLRVTREGWYWLVTAFLMAGTGLYKGINLLTLLACLMLAVWLLHGLSSARRIRQLRGRRFLQEPIFAGEPSLLEIQVHNPAPRAQFGLVLQDQGPDGPLVRQVPVLGGNAAGVFTWQITWPRRGVVSVGPLTVSSRLPFGLKRRTGTLSPQEAVVVLPSLGQVHRGRLRRRLAQTPFNLGRGRQFARRHPAAQADLHGLRVFRSGDSPRWIHWPTTARIGELMIREFEESPTENLIVVLEPAGPAAPGADPNARAAHFEAAIRMTATICWEWCRQTGDRLVLAVAGPVPEVLSGLTGRDLALRFLGRLAQLPHDPTGDRAGLVENLAACELPLAPLLLIGTGPSELGDQMAERLRRPVTRVDVSDPTGHDFYERSPVHAS
jgi:uncharacterized protein (DUF58 family)